MNTLMKFATVSVLALMVAAPASAQNRIVGIEALNDEIDDITDDVNTEIARGSDADRFGPNGVAQGWRGSFALSASGTSGNTDTGEVSGAGRLTYGVNCLLNAPCRTRPSWPIGRSGNAWAALAISMGPKTMI